MSGPTLFRTGLATAGAAAAGAVAVDPDSAWYRSLNRPAWQPPAEAFPPVWTALYASIAFAGARALDASTGDGQRRWLRRLYGINLALNAGWTPLFFRARRPRLALAEIIALDGANVALAVQAWRADRVAGAALLPYLAWTGFATGLNAAIAARNPGR
ncbi:tryptophan-rich sensory protein [Frankia sp. CNm7]|uniref:Tryptophan-rich sensory protein n=1 Tax=Frankia nepalensis TaxID=1836974 RepID=A0A937RF70_9ACTN|nr:TspO/MBR family protein [Frankia nepalensis]MBL7497636.1 tryptophan-rich sensory protein [Frankia nepalensis]MBL7510050.1 tryptophan-rich sensory protein [Frankia nepalensis]MBL7517540.1 tryptophan-rich sensory protein [Frankia nepalensis]MBL7631071.1 tryptophan-rich sensory protein [Frankia nepalensis]